MRAKILIVEDDSALRRQFRSVLSDAGFEVCEVSSGGEARNRLMAEDFDVAITDINLGDGLSGVSLAAQRFLDYPETKVVVVTGMTGLESSAVGRAGFPGAHATLFKPVSPEHLVKTVEKALMS